MINPCLPRLFPVGWLMDLMWWGEFPAFEVKPWLYCKVFELNPEKQVTKPIYKT